MLKAEAWDQNWPVLMGSQPCTKRLPGQDCGGSMKAWALPNRHRTLSQPLHPPLPSQGPSLSPLPLQLA